MFQQEYYVPKDSGTYANALEAFGLAFVLSKILGEKTDTIQILDASSHYTILLKTPITRSMVETTQYFDGFQYIKFKDNLPESGYCCRFKFLHDIHSEYRRIRRAKSISDGLQPASLYCRILYCLFQKTWNQRIGQQSFYFAVTHIYHRALLC
jgi:hypothetical protein